MKLFKTLVTVSFLSLLPAQAAMASSISFSDTFNPLDVFLSGQANVACTGTNGLVTDTTSASSCESLVFTQTLSGFNSATDTLTSGTLSLTLYNDANDGTEHYTLVVDALTFPSNAAGQTIPGTSTVGSPFIGGPYNVLSQLADGQIQVTITADNGNHDFMFGQSVLTVSGTRTDTESGGFNSQATSPVPEPGSLVLLGTGLAGVGLRWRSRRKAA